MNYNDISVLLRQWNKNKIEMCRLEEECDRYKKAAEKLLNRQGGSILSSDEFQLTRRQISRDTISKCNVPADIWKKYARRSTYPAWFLTAKK